MASACMDKLSMSPEAFLSCPAAKYSSYGWLSRDIRQETPKGSNPKPHNQPKQPPVSTSEKAELIDFVDFEFCLDDPVNMLPADELFSNGKLMPLQITNMKSTVASSTAKSTEVMPPDTPKLCTTNSYLFSPKAPRCSSRWKELLGLKKLSQREKENNQKSTLPSNTLKSLIQRGSKTSSSLSSDSSINLPLLKDSDTESVSISSSRMSLSSSSSGHEHDDLPRLSLDSSESNKSNNITFPRGIIGVTKSKRYQSAASSSSENVPMRRQQETNYVARGMLVDSPRMNSSGKIIFHSLERSSSTPTSNGGGGARYNNRGMERCYSTNVPVCSLFVDPQTGSFFVFILFIILIKKLSSCNIRTVNNKNRLVN
ncbi:hypothetical protein Leryth_010169 [Lithospermum erythrorhizon]|nr:hypothetical protein Leryth_010169 [Lithospermum erythrorhizon]